MLVRNSWGENWGMKAISQYLMTILMTAIFPTISGQFAL